MKKTNVIMNIRSVILSAAKNLFLLAVIAGLTGNLLASCDKLEDAISHGGFQPDEEQLEAFPSITLRAVSSADNVVKVNLPEGETQTSVKVYAYSNKTYDFNNTLLIQVEESLLETYNALHNKASFKLLPSTFYSIENDGIISIAASEKISNTNEIIIYVVNRFENRLSEGNYLLPLLLSDGQGEIRNSLFIEITIQPRFSGRPELYTGSDCQTIFYVNTSIYDPRLITDFVVEKTNLSFERIWYSSIGNILNLRTVSIDFDKVANIVSLNPSSDLKYLCSHFETYLRPIKETGRKLCVCIESGKKEIGFCNMADNQIEKLVYEITQFVNEYDFDGINLWDKNTYDTEGAPAFSTTSYPKLIKRLRESLSKDKIITLVDYESPTAYFWDLDATGGIKVGEYLDYAWSGYNKNNEPVQIVDPYHEIDGSSIKHARKPIAGLKESCYGKINCPWYPATVDLNWITNDAIKWMLNGGSTEGILVFDDIRSLLQDEYEGATFAFPGNWLTLFDINSLQYGFDANRVVYSFDTSNMVGTQSGYNKWVKQW